MSIYEVQAQSSSNSLVMQLQYDGRHIFVRTSYLEEIVHLIIDLIYVDSQNP
jgi:hypothetical protein